MGTPQGLIGKFHAPQLSSLILGRYRVVRLRSLLCANHTTALMLVIMALIMIVLVPGGFMPGFNKGTFTAEICAEWSGTDPIAQLVSTHHKSGKDHKEHTRASHVCPYATLVMAAVSGADAALVLQTLTYILALGFMPVVAPVLQRAAKLRPPLRGPPPVSRA